MNLSVEYKDAPDKSDPLNQRRVLNIKIDGYEVVVAWSEDMLGPVFAEVTQIKTTTVRAR